MRTPCVARTGRHASSNWTQIVTSDATARLSPCFCSGGLKRKPIEYKRTMSDGLIWALAIGLPAIAGFVSHRVGPVVLGAVVSWIALGIADEAITDSELHVEGIGLLFSLAVLAGLAALGAWAGTAIRGGASRSS